MKTIRNWPLILTVLVIFLGFTGLFLIFQNRGPSPSPSLFVEGQPRDFHRIICAAPSITEMVFALGRGPAVVGVSDFSFYPPEAKNVARIGGLFNPSREKILALDPDLVVYQGKHRALAGFCQERSIPSLSLTIDCMTDITEAILTLGAALQTEEEAARLAENIRRELDELTSKTSTRPPRRVFLGLGHTPGDLTGLMTTSSGTFLHELLEAAGGSNIFADARGSYPRISKEALVQRRPEIIIEVLAEGLSPDNQKLLEEDWRRLTSLPAVRAGQIHFLSDDYLLIPGIRVTKTALRLASVIHPELFEDRHD
jgi:iron complex transport system substrate-binding protein